VSRVSITEMFKTPAAIWAPECASLGVSGRLLSSSAVSLQGISVSTGSGTGFGAVATVAVPRPRPMAPKGLRAEGQHGQPATSQHTYNYNPAVNGDVAVGAVGPPHREPV